MKDIEIIYSDSSIIVCRKPAGAVCEATDGKESMITLLSEILSGGNDSKPRYVGLVHRLDRPTGGVMVFAKTSKAAGRLGEQIKNGEMFKKYLTVVDGKPKQDGGKLINYLAKNNNYSMPEPYYVQVSQAERNLEKKND